MIDSARLIYARCRRCILITEENKTICDCQQKQVFRINRRAQSRRDRYRIQRVLHYRRENKTLEIRRRRREKRSDGNKVGTIATRYHLLHHYHSSESFFLCCPLFASTLRLLQLRYASSMPWLFSSPRSHLHHESPSFWTSPIRSYTRSPWSFMDFSTPSLYLSRVGCLLLTKSLLSGWTVSQKRGENCSQSNIH